MWNKFHQTQKHKKRKEKNFTKMEVLKQNRKTRTGKLEQKWKQRLSDRMNVLEELWFQNF